ncbi:DUF4440 domain-containing protein [Rhodoferax koreense]|uniref:DUF4440 domain-containing protein n=1 Tax=Rhodoferax koreensis TaxID=1842727 RepID=A0A1P8K0Y0_9BURK|nr:nuclear transport factor 2 family protein [Rhodoferax koreense]APW39591.1 DUF4440 domain-containing protein [Rhodoferax koreense]
MPDPSKSLIDLETRFWQSMVDNETAVALGLLTEPSMMVSAHGAMQFDHAAYRKMAEQGKMVVKSYAFSDMQVQFPNETTAIVSYKVRQGIAERDKSEVTFQEMVDSSTWVQVGSSWRCALHTEAPLASAGK